MEVEKQMDTDLLKKKDQEAGKRGKRRREGRGERKEAVGAENLVLRYGNYFITVLLNSIIVLLNSLLKFHNYNL